MAQFFQVDPEVAGGWGDNTIATVTTTTTIVHKLHYEFEGWLGDCLLESVPCYIITEEAALAIERQSLTGIELDNVEISKSDVFLQLQGDVELPKFKWLKITGIATKADFGCDNRFRLVLSERAVELLKSFGLENAEVEVYSP